MKINQQSSNTTRVSKKADTKGKPIEIGKSCLAQKSCVIDAICLWNMALEKVTNSPSLSVAESEIKKFVRQLPI